MIRFVLLFLAGLLSVHLAKAFRLYLVLMEHELSFIRFLFLYTRTTLVNLIIPYKLGEIYRMIAISRATKHWQVGILSILVDRFFDTLALCVILVPLDLAYYGSLTAITVIFMAALLLIALCYISVLPSYRYLNHYIIVKKSSGRSMAALKGLDVVKIWFDFTKNLIRGRFGLIFLSSLAGWILEIATLKVLAVYLHVSFGIGDYISYVQAIFGQGENELLSPYNVCGILLLTVLTVLSLVWYLMSLSNRKKELA